MAEVMTYNSLVTSIRTYSERPADDTEFIAEIPRLVMLAENRIATDMKQQGFQSVVTGAFTAGAPGAVIAKPAFWRQTISFQYLDPTLGWQPVYLRNLEYLKSYWPNAASLGTPKFYADYNFQNFFVAPSPAAAYAFELVYYARLQPLDAANQVNWLTVNAPQVLLYACLLEAQLYLKNTDRAAFWKAQYDDQKGGILNENAERLADRNEVVTRA